MGKKRKKPSAFEIIDLILKVITAIAALISALKH